MSSTLAQNAMMIIVGWQAYSLARLEMDTHAAAAQLGFIGLAQFVPLFLLTPVSGWVADRFDRRIVGVSAALLLITCAATLAVATYENWVSLPLIFAIAVVLGIARCFSGAALGAVAARIVPRDILPRAIAFSSMAWQSSAIIGPALGGMLFAWLPWLPYAGSTMLFILAAILLLTLPPLPAMRTSEVRHPVRQMLDGIVYVGSNRLVLGTITLDLMAVLLAGATALMPVYARDLLKVGASGLGQLASAPGAGALLTAALLGIRQIENDVGRKMLAAVGVFGLGTIVFGLTALMPSGIAFPIAVGALLACGAADMISVYIRQSLIQIYTPDEMRGRVGSVSQLTISASNELGEAESGFLASLVGPVAAVVGGGIGAIVITLLWARLFPELARAKRFDTIHTDPLRNHETHKTESGT